MSYSKTESNVLRLAEGIAVAQGYDIYDVEYVKEGPHLFLRVYITSEDGVNLDDCEVISRSLGDILDTEDIIKENYFLEVSSPGIERLLRQNSHFDGAIGEKIKVMQKNGKSFEGVLTANSDNSIILDGEKEIKKQDIKRANIIFDFNL